MNTKETDYIRTFEALEIKGDYLLTKSGNVIAKLDYTAGNEISKDEQLSNVEFMANIVATHNELLDSLLKQLYVGRKLMEQIKQLQAIIANLESYSKTSSI